MPSRGRKAEESEKMLKCGTLDDAKLVVNLICLVVNVIYLLLATGQFHYSISCIIYRDQGWGSGVRECRLAWAVTFVRFCFCFQGFLSFKVGFIMIVRLRWATIFIVGLVAPNLVRKLKQLIE